MYVCICVCVCVCVCGVCLVHKYVRWLGRRVYKGKNHTLYKSIRSSLSDSIIDKVCMPSPKYAGKLHGIALNTDLLNPFAPL